MVLTPLEIERYKRHLVLREVGGQGQQKLQDARVLAVGAGGLGSPEPSSQRGHLRPCERRPRPSHTPPTDGTERHGNSIFIYETANMCIAHLGHLHHTLNQQQLNEIGKVDIVFVPVDGSMTLDLEGMMEVLQALKAPLMIPMHFFSTFTLHRFLERARQSWTVEMSEIPSLVVSKTSLPATPKVTVLPGH